MSDGRRLADEARQAYEQRHQPCASCGHRLGVHVLSFGPCSDGWQDGRRADSCPCPRYRPAS